MTTSRRARPSRLSHISRFIPAPTVVGAAALVLAGAGAVVVSSTGGSTGDTQVAGGSLQALSVNLTAEDTAAGPTTRTHLVRDRSGDMVRVSRDVDREELEQQAALQADQRTEALQDLAQAAQKESDNLLSEQWVLPLAGYSISAGFGEAGYLWASGYHTGLDLSAAEGTPIAAVAPGTITHTGYDYSASWAGNLTVLQLENGDEIWYAHQSSISVSPGDQVAPGEVIGYVGSTGNSTGPHLHLEVHPGGGDPVDPMAVLLEHGVTP